MKRVLIVAALLLVAGAAVWWLLPSGDGEQSGSGTASGAPAELESAEGAAKPLIIKPSSWAAEPEAKGSLRISGRVTDGEGQPVANATVTATARHGEDVLSDLSCHCDNACGQKLLECGCPEAAAQLVELVAARTGEAPPLARTTTDGDGVFHLEGLANGEVAIWADAAQGMGLRGSATPGDEHADIVVSAGRTVTGKVTGVDDQPLAGVYVTAIYSEQSRFFDATTDFDGKFRFEHLPMGGSIAVVAMKDGLLPDEAHVRGDRARELTLRLFTPRKLAGKVTRDGKPAAGAELSLEGEHKKQKRTTDGEGRFQFDGLRPGEYEVSARLGSDIASGKFEVAKDADLLDATLSLGAGYILRGVVRGENGQPIAHATVSIESGDDWRKAKTDAEGRYELPPVPAGGHEVWVEAEDFRKDKRTIRVDKTSTQDFTLTAGLRIAGVVQDESGAPIDGAKVSATHGSYEDDDRDWATAKMADGGFALKGLLATEYEVTVVADGFKGASKKVTPPADDLRFTLSSGAVAFGRVTDVDGKPIEGAQLAAKPDQGSSDEDLFPEFGSKTSARSDASGAYELKGLASGKAILTAWVTSGEDESRGMRRVSKPVVIPETGRVRVDLRLPPALKVSGTAVDESGAAVKGARVIVQGIDRAGSFATGKTDAEGHFAVSGMDPGEVTVAVWAEDFEHSQPLKTHAGDDRVRVVLKALPQAVGRLVDESGAPVSEAEINFGEVKLTDGRFSVGVHAREKIINLHIRAKGFAEAQAEKPATGKRTDFGDIRLERGRVLEGMVVDAETGAPVVGALVDVGQSAEVPKPGDFYIAKEAGAVKTDAQGHFMLPAVDSRHNYIAARHPDFIDATRPLRADETNVQLMMKKGASLEVHAFDRQGNPVGGGFVVALSATGEHSSGRITSGSLTLKGLAAGEWTLRYEGSSATLRALKVTVAGSGAQQVDWREPSDGVDVKVQLAPGQEAILFQGHLDPAQAQNPDGAFKNAEFVVAKQGAFKNVSPGAYTLVAYDSKARSITLEDVAITSAPGQVVQFTSAAKTVASPRAELDDEGY